MLFQRRERRDTRRIAEKRSKMKLLTCLAICLISTIALTASLQAQAPNETEVKLELNEAAAAYRKGNFVEAQAHSERALQLDPENRTALIFVARSTHAQYKPGDSSPENVAKAREAIVAYQRVLERSLVDEESYKAVAYLYDALKEDQLLREWVLQRARNVAVADDKRAEAYVIVASRDWDCSYKITELPGVKVTTVNRNKEQVSYRMPKARGEFEKARECANRALDLINMAITLTPESETAWAYKTNIILELAKLAEMSGDAQQKEDLYRQYEAALKETTRLSNRTPSKP
jgi:tetratricopeptide (TPR) repeat protein